MPPRFASATAPALDDSTLPPPAPRLHDFEHWRAELKLRATRVPSRPGLQALLDRLRRLDRRQVAAASVTTVLALVWWLWPSAPLQLPPSPRTYPPSLTAVALMPGWADVDRLGRSAATRASTPAPPAARSRQRVAVADRLVRGVLAPRAAGHHGDACGPAGVTPCPRRDRSQSVAGAADLERRPDRHPEIVEPCARQSR